MFNALRIEDRDLFSAVDSRITAIDENLSKQRGIFQTLYRENRQQRLSVSNADITF